MSYAHPLTESGESTDTRALESAARGDLDEPVSIGDLLADVIEDIEYMEIAAADGLRVRLGDAGI
jgi:hypothetical protein